MQILPITNIVNQRFTTVLGDIELKFHFWYQKIGDGWYCDIEKISGEVIISGTRISSMAPLLSSTLSDIDGDIVPIALTPTELSAEPWGVTHKLIYFTSAEIAALQ